MQVYSDLHIHIGRTADGKPVKITAAESLTWRNVLHTAAKEKGLDMVGFVDAACLGVLRELQQAMQEEAIFPLSGGGYSDGTITFLPGSEVELAHEGNGRSAHFLAFFPTLEKAQDYTRALEGHVTNPTLSSQKLRISSDDWIKIVYNNNGIALAAHAFTPHKGVYGNCVSKMSEMFSDPHKIAALELGLSADTQMASVITDTRTFPFISNSDAHSLGKIAREFTVYNMPRADFESWVNVLTGKGGRIASTHGMEPVLGKYHRSFCPKCRLIASDDEPTFQCPSCAGRMIQGVWDRVMSLRGNDPNPPTRPPYVPHIPLELIPGLGPKSRKKLLQHLGSEIRILYECSEEDIAQIVGSNIAAQIIAARQGRLPLVPGGGGYYGKVKKCRER